MSMMTAMSAKVIVEAQHTEYSTSENNLINLRLALNCNPALIEPIKNLQFVGCVSQRKP
jgi:hypothetical protein